MIPSFITKALLLLNIVVIASAQLSLHSIPKDFADSYGAACLDGSPPALYHAPAADPSYSNRWIIFFEGGG